MVRVVAVEANGFAVHYVVGPAPADEGAEDVAEGVGDCGLLMGGLVRVQGCRGM